MALDFINTLMEAKRKARLMGRPLSAQETQGISQGYFADAAQRVNAARAAALAERSQTFKESSFDKELNQRRYETEKQIEAANAARSAQAMNTAIGTGGMAAFAAPGLYKMGKEAGYWGVGESPAVTEAIPSSEALPTITGNAMDAGAGMPRIAPSSEIYGAGEPVKYGAMDAGAGMPTAVPASEAGAATLAGEGGVQSLSAGELAGDPLLTGVDALSAEGAGLGTMGTLGLAAGGAYLAGKGMQAIAPEGTVVNRTGQGITGTLEWPITAVTDPGKAINQAQTAVSDYITRPIEQAFHAVTGGSCIVYGYLYGNKSRQVRTAMMFCGEFMDKAALLGYYSIGHYILIPAARRWRWADKFIRKVMAEPFFSFMQYRLGHRPETSRWSRAFAGMFLPSCRAWYHARLPIHYPPGFEKCIRSAEKREVHEDLSGDVGNTIIP